MVSKPSLKSWMSDLIFFTYVTCQLSHFKCSGSAGYIHPSRVSWESLSNVSIWDPSGLRIRWVQSLVVELSSWSLDSAGPRGCRWLNDSPCNLSVLGLYPNDWSWSSGRGSGSWLCALCHSWIFDLFPFPVLFAKLKKCSHSGVIAFRGCWMSVFSRAEVKPG